MKALPLLSATLLLSLSPLSANLLDHGDAESEGLRELSGVPIERTSDHASEGKHAYAFTEKKTYTLEQLIPVDPQKTYELSVKLRSADPENPASANFGISMYDAEKQHISICQVSPIEGTSTTLMNPLEAGSREAWVTDAKSWKGTANYHRIAFNIEENYGDLPNHHYSPRLEAIEPSGEGWKVTFREPIQKPYPADTPIRLHKAWLAGIYWVANAWVPETWTTYSTTLHGELPQGISSNEFWRGTRYVRVTIRFGNWDRIPKEGAKLLADEIVFREITPKE